MLKIVRMPSRRFRLWLALAVAAGLASCELNPQPPIPDRSFPHSPGTAGTKSNMDGDPSSGPIAMPGSGGLGLGGGSATGGSLTIDIGGNNDATSGGPGLIEGGASGGEEPGAGGAGGAGGGDGSAGGAGGDGSGPPPPK